MESVTTSSSSMVQSRLMRMIREIKIPDEQVEKELLEYFALHGTPGTSSGTGSGFFYDRNSIVASTWIIIHGLQRYPQVTIIDDDGNLIDADIFYGSLNQVTITFAEPQSGKAVLL